MKSIFLRRVEQNIRRHGLIRRGEGLLVAISGGLDSMVLMHALAELAPSHGWKLTVAHFDHGLRGSESIADREFVAASGARLDLPVVTGAIQGGVQRGRGQSIEMAARVARHRFLIETCQRLGLCKVALAHQADDQAELFFVRLFRGASPSGLAGMPWAGPSAFAPEVTLVRPLLDFSRAELGDFVAKRHWVHREDSTNRSTEPLRNRIRHELIPLLKERFQPGVVETVNQAMEILREESALVGEAARAWRAGQGKGRFDDLPGAVQRRVLELGLREAGAEPGYVLIEALRRRGEPPIHLDAGRQISRDERGQITILPIPPRPGPGSSPEQVNFDLQVGTGKIALGGTRIAWRVSARRPGPVHLRRRPGSEMFDAEKVGGTIRLRFWRPGDRFQPIGMARPVKLQDLFVNARIPRADRMGLVLAEAENGVIFWVEGLRIGEQFKLDKATRRQLKWGWRRV